MESVWEEKKLQALFSELKAADEHAAPRFARVWNRAQVAQPTRAFNPAFVGATALLVCALVSLAVWSRYSQRTQPPTVAVAGPTSPKTSAAKAAENSGTPLTPEVIPIEEVSTPRANKRAARRNALLAGNRKLTRDAKAITSWESPTTALLSSPSDEVFSSLPTLDQSASDLKSFLPNRSN